MAQPEPWSPSWTPSWTTSAPLDDPPLDDPPLEVTPAAPPAPPRTATPPLPVGLPVTPPAGIPAVPPAPPVPPAPSAPPPDPAAPATTAPPTTATEAFPISRRAPRQARAFVADALYEARVGDPRILDVAQLLTSEVAPKAIERGTGQPFIVAVTVDAQSVVVGLQDGGPSPALAPDRPDDWGATLVDALADEWGADTTERGRVFWFRLLRR